MTPATNWRRLDGRVLLAIAAALVVGLALVLWSVRSGRRAANTTPAPQGSMAPGAAAPPGPPAGSTP